MSETVVEHNISRLHDVGAKDVFGVPGDFAFPLDNAVCDNESMR